MLTPIVFVGALTLVVLSPVIHAIAFMIDLVVEYVLLNPSDGMPCVQRSFSLLPTVLDT